MEICARAHVPRGTMMLSFLVVTALAYPFLSLAALPDEITKIFAIHILFFMVRSVSS